MHWAGTETATKWTGYMDGAVLAGYTAANNILNIFNYDVISTSYDDVTTFQPKQTPWWKEKRNKRWGVKKWSCCCLGTVAVGYIVYNLLMRDESLPKSNEL